MIVVIADDITGAAEIAGLGIQHGLSVEMSLSVDTGTSADMLVIATDARSLPEDQAVAIMKEITAQVAALRPVFVYKKTDSVLRGHVLAEVKAQMQLLGKRSALIVPANPAMGRVIVDGEYRINDVPIAETGFAYDPEFPAKSSKVSEMLRAEANELTICKPDGIGWLAGGIAVAEAATQADMKYWAQHTRMDTLMAGGAGFFNEWMNEQYFVKEKPVYPTESPLGNRILYICGTAFTKTHEKIAHQHTEKENVCYMPETVAFVDIEESGIRDWAKTIKENLADKRQLIVAIPPAYQERKPDAALLRRKMALAVAAVLGGMPVGDLLIEGGSSGFAILKELGLSRFAPVQLLAPGVLRLRSEEKPGLFLTLKPGSYHWPDYIWQH